MRAYRIGDGRRPLFDGTGAMLHGGRWNSPGRLAIYAAETYACAMLEVLVHSNLSRVPRNHAFIAMEIPDSVHVEDIALSQLPGWPQTSEDLCRKLGDAWLESRSSAVLRVPSVVTAGHERNLVLNPAHRDFLRIKPTAAQPILWDPRLFPHVR